MNDPLAQVFWCPWCQTVCSGESEGVGACASCAQALSEARGVLTRAHVLCHLDAYPTFDSARWDEIESIREENETAPELRPPTERERARASLMEFTGMWFDGMSDEERRELAVKLGEAFRKVKEADNEQGD